MADYCLKTFFDFGGYPQDKSEDAQHNRRVDDQRGYYGLRGKPIWLSPAKLAVWYAILQHIYV